MEVTGLAEYGQNGQRGVGKILGFGRLVRNHIGCPFVQLGSSWKVLVEKLLAAIVEIANPLPLGLTALMPGNYFEKLD
jgi:hypothetical protein